MVAGLCIFCISFKNKQIKFVLSGNKHPEIFFFFFSFFRVILEDLLFVTVNLKALYLGALAVRFHTTLVSTPRSETTLDG